MSLPDQDGFDDQAAPRAQGLLPVSMRDQSTLAIMMCLIIVFGTVYFLVSAIWQPGFVQHDSAPSLVVVFQVDINTAAWPEIAALPGIGPTRARQIVQWRETNGPFVSIDDIARIHGIGPATLKRIGPYLRRDEHSPRLVVAKPPLPIENPAMNPAGQ